MNLSSAGDRFPVYDETEALALIRLRYWQHLLNEMLKAKAFKVPVHLAFGHEAAAVGVDLTMQTNDALCVTHRNGAYNLARAKSFARELEHYRLQTTDAKNGEMGSMNLAMANTGIAYSSSILGNNLPVGLGIAMNRKLRRLPGVVFILTGDGAMEEGVFWESLVFARSHNLGIVVVLENNNFSLASNIEQRRCPINLSKVCGGLQINYRRASGADLLSVKVALQGAREEASVGHPSVVELDIITFNHHSGPTPGWATDTRRIAIEDGLLMGEDKADPLVRLRDSIGAEKFNQIETRIRQERHIV